jgi:hypothetical protein
MVSGYHGKQAMQEQGCALKRVAFVDDFSKAIVLLLLQLYAASGYLAKQTLHCVGDIFVGARRTMDWLTSSAKIVAGRRPLPHPLSGQDRGG